MLSVLAKDNFQERRVEVPGGRGDLARRDGPGRVRKRDMLPSSLPWCAMIQGMKRNLTLD